MSRRLLFAAAILLLVGNIVQANSTRLERPNVNPEIKPSIQTISDRQGRPQNVAVTRSQAGVQSEFVEGVILVRPDSDEELQRFLARFGGTVIADNRIPVPPPEFDVVLSDEQRKATVFTVRIDLNRINRSSSDLSAHSSDHVRRRDFSSERGLLTFLAGREARDAGFRVSLNYIAKRNQAFPSVMFNSQERPINNPAGTFPDAFAEPRYGATGSQTNVALAWQFVAAHGIQRRVRVAILDAGFWLTPTGFPRGADNDLAPPGVRPLQFDIDRNDVTADGPNSSPCTAMNPCFWHGTGSAAVAVGIMNNSLGQAGTGSLVGDPVLIKLQDLTRENEATAVRMAILFGADVISMSWSSDCDSVECREDHRDIDPFADAVNSGSRVVFVAAAGNSSKSVDSPSFVHPCIERHVICVGALNDNATTIAGSSNFGAGVDIFAPTNIPVMSFPPSADASGPLPLSQAFGAERPQSFGGTSASTPFIAGIVAMMKAINPALNSDEVSGILTATASPGVLPVTRIVNALAAVRGAAEGLAMIKDRLEPNDLESQSTILSSPAPHTLNGLNLGLQDRDYFQFNSPASSTATITLTFPEALSSISVHSFEALGSGCPAPTLLSDTAIAGGRGHALRFRVPGGPLRLGLRATGTNAYNLGVSFTQAILNADAYEANNVPSEARYLYSRKLGQSLVGLSFDPRFRIEATIHSVFDVDYYIVQGASMTMAEQVLLSGHSAVRVYGNDSPIRLEVYNLNPDNTQGTLVAAIGGGSCAAEPLSVRIEPGAYYLVKISGTPGNYVLSNGVGGEKRRIPPLMRDQIYEVLNPGEPVIHALRNAGNYVFSADSRFRAVQTSDPRTFMRLFDAENNVIADSVSHSGVASLSLARTRPGHVYGLYVSQEREHGTRAVQLSWQPNWPMRVSSNVFLAAHQRAARSAETPAAASLDHQQMSDRHQIFALDPQWRNAIDAGRVEASFSAFMRAGSGSEALSVRLTFLADDQRELGTLTLPTVTLKESQGEQGLLPVRLHDRVPEHAAFVRVHVRSADGNGSPDQRSVNNLELILTEFAP